MRPRFLLAAALICPAAPIAASDAPPALASLPGGARWAAQVPERWNGTLLLWSRGYSARIGNPELGPPPVAAAVLAQGYAIAASDYGAAGWALEEAVPAQLAAIAAFSTRYGKPKRVVALGYSMGGLVTTALAERRPAAIDGAVAFCASIGGSVGMMNMALDGAYAFRTLLAPDAGIRVVAVDDDMANARRVEAAVADALKTPQGRARLALVGVLAGIPGWTDPAGPAPAAGDADGEARQMAAAIARGVFLPRADQEKRAGGIFSWNSGIDYRAQLARSGRRGLVEALYRRAGLDLDGDLGRLGRGTRIAADARAVRYMTANYAPSARPSVPLVAVQAIGDGLTSPSMQRAYVEAAGARARALWVEQAGHCGFRPETVVAAVHYVEARLNRGRWGERPAGFVAYRPAPMLRPCFRGRTCR